MTADLTLVNLSGIWLTQSNLMVKNKYAQKSKIHFFPLNKPSSRINKYRDSALCAEQSFFSQDWDFRQLFNWWDLPCQIQRLFYHSFVLGLQFIFTFFFSAAKDSLLNLEQLEAQTQELLFAEENVIHIENKYINLKDDWGIGSLLTREMSETSTFSLEKLKCCVCLTKAKLLKDVWTGFFVILTAKLVNVKQAFRSLTPDIVDS